MRTGVISCVTGLLAGLFGCSGTPTSSGSGGSPKADTSLRKKFGDVEFIEPIGWTREKVGDGLLLLAPEMANNWQANLFMEFREDVDTRPLDEALADLASSLKNQKKQFSEVSRKVEPHEGGFQMGRLEYTCTDQGTPLTEWEVVVDLGGKKRLFILGSSASASWEKYRPVFQAFVGSLRK